MSRTVEVFGTKPTAIPRPVPGYWWVRFASPLRVLPGENRITWESTQEWWTIVAVGHEQLEVIGSDVELDWADEMSVPILLGPEIKEPQL